MENRKRIYICGFNQESNSFNVSCATIEKFQVKEKEDLKTERENAQLNGVLKGMQVENMVPIFGTLFWATPGAIVADEVVEDFLQRVENDLKTIGEFDGVAIIYHGATIAETQEDACGYMSECIRRIVGEEKPITASFDLHANITEKVAKNVDFICGFQEYPHLDIFETGYRSVKMLGEYFKNPSVKTYRASVPVIASASGYTTISAPAP